MTGSQEGGNGSGSPGSSMGEANPNQSPSPMEAMASDQKRSDRTVIQLHGVSRRFRTETSTTTALDEVDFAMSEGEFVTVVGPSGCGKTTLLRIIAGLTRPTDGVALMGETPISGPRPDIGIVFQQPQLLPWRSAFENVLLPAEVLKGDMDQAKRRSMDLLETVGLKGFEDHLPKQLSGGMQQRVAIARGLLPSPSLLLMDEPFGALDALTREQMALELQRISQRETSQGKTVFFITHSISEAVFLADRVVVMTAQPGKIAEVIEVPFAKPRDINLLNSGGEFGQLVSYIRSLLSVEDRSSPVGEQS